MIKNFLTVKGNDMFFNGTYMEIYIPSKYFEKKLSTNMGQYMDTWGVLIYTVFNDKDKAIAHGVLNLPSKIVLYPHDIEYRKMSLTIDKKTNNVMEDRYCICKFYKNNKVMPAFVVQNSDNVELFLKLLMNGDIGLPVPYTKVMELWYMNLELNNVSFRVPISTLGILIREVYRDKRNLDNTYAVTMGKNPNTDPWNYTTLNSRQITSRTSVFTALTFEDADAMITSSLNMSSSGRKQNISPIEKVIKM